MFSVRQIRRRAAAWLFAALYALAALAGGSWHSHDHSLHRHAAGDLAAHADHDSGHRDPCCHEHGGGRDRRCGDPGDPCQQEDCSVCRALAQAPLSVAAAPPPLTATLCAVVQPLPLRRDSASLSLTLHARAPPRSAASV